MMRSLRGAVLVLFSCVAPLAAQNTTNFPHLGEIVRLDPAFDKLIGPDAVIEVLGSGFEWSEGPVWVPEGQSGYLLFSDIPRNSVMRWDYGKGVSLFLKPSGYTGAVEYGNEPGCNGLMLDPQGQLVSCEHGDRRVSILTKNGGKRTLVDNYQGKRLNSPNDGCFKSNGDLYFTDPPYGLPGNFDDPRRELDFCGVYRLQIGKDGVNKTTLLTDGLTRPNGIAFSPDEKFLYVAQSDPKAAIWKKFPVKEDGTLGEGKVFFDATEYVGKHKGLPDGLKVDKAGNVWATGPGGVWVFSPEGKPLGRLDTKEATANCAWGDDGTTLYITADMYLCRVKTLTRGAGW
ncbi:MAG: SMP-30/gluconolactonase/LRE family protein [Planctomycetaceae bacterium]|nr:SMP-30/gluconolactonase/LRE family protein [Planctomycetaceae bacterium]